MTLLRTCAYLALTVFFVSGSVAARGDTFSGGDQKLGNGTIKTYAELGANGKPIAIGVTFTRQALEGLPVTKTTTGRCFDINKNGRIDPASECEGDYEYRLAMPEKLSVRGDIPFKWVGFNWHPGGHVPPGIFDLPHFDMHFYMVSHKEIDAIRLGACDIFINCDDRKRALVPVKPKYVHPDHINVGATVSLMGNHLINSKSPEFGRTPDTKKKFTHTWIFGAYDGKITFYEPMITLEYLQSRPKSCFNIKSPKAWQKAGYYPTRYCIRYNAGDGKYTVSLEDLVLRNAE
jgi:Hypothetical protein TTHB210